MQYSHCIRDKRIAEVDLHVILQIPPCFYSPGRACFAVSLFNLPGFVFSDHCHCAGVPVKEGFVAICITVNWHQSSSLVAKLPAWLLLLRLQKNRRPSNRLQWLRPRYFPFYCICFRVCSFQYHVFVSPLVSSRSACFVSSFSFHDLFIIYRSSLL